MPSCRGRDRNQLLMPSCRERDRRLVLVSVARQGNRFPGTTRCQAMPAQRILKGARRTQRA
uniref:Uncharacterized protein n=1 Tax=Arundo donax TaxID=35708 RepID=A0A0A9ACS8_ARUDO